MTRYLSHGSIVLGHYRDRSANSLSRPRLIPESGPSHTTVHCVGRVHRECQDAAPFCGVHSTSVHPLLCAENHALSLRTTVACADFTDLALNLRSTSIDVVHAFPGLVTSAVPFLSDLLNWLSIMTHKTLNTNTNHQGTQLSGPGRERSTGHGSNRSF